MVLRSSNGVPFVVLEPEPSVRTGIRVEIYDGAAPNTLLEVLQDSFARRWTDPLKGPGSGTFNLYATDPKVADNPALLAYGNIARFYLDGVPRFAITIEHKKRVQLAEDEDAARVLVVSGRGGLAKLEEAQTYPAGGLAGDVERPFTTNAGDELKTLVDEAQTRGALAGVTYDFDDTVDSHNAPWDTPIDHTERAGTDLLRVAARLGDIAADVRMTPTLVLQAFNTRGIDRSVQLVDVGPVVLQAADNLEALESDEDGAIRNALLVETPGGWVERVEAASVSTHRRREAFLSLGNVTAGDQIDRAVEAVFERSANPAESKTLKVLDKEGHRPYVDWNVGDWVLAPDEAGNLERFRVRAITVTEDDEGRPEFVPELATITEELEERLERWLAAMARGTMGGTAGTIAEPVKAPAEVTEAVEAGVDEHEAIFAHPDELSDLADVDVAGLANRDLLRYDATAGEWVPLGVRIDVVTDPPVDGEVLKYHAASGLWLPKPDSGGGGGGGGGAGKAELYVPTGAGGDDFADGSIHGDWTAVNRGAVAGINWSEAYNQLRFLKSDATGWGTRDIAAQMRPVSLGVGDYLEVAVRFRMRLAFWGWCLILADGNTWGAGTQLVLWGHQPNTVTLTHRIELANYTNYSAIGTRHGTVDVVPVEDSLYVRLEKSGASEFKSYWAPLGEDWVLVDTTVGGPSFTVTHAGVGILNFDNPAAPQAVAFDYFETSV